MTTGPIHLPDPIAGYHAGIIQSDKSPVTEYTDRGDQPAGNMQNGNDWFYINNSRYNVHPYRFDLNGYPVRWIETLNYDTLEIDSSPDAAVLRYVDQMVAFDDER